jgi:hypothetical protein
VEEIKKIYKKKYEINEYKIKDSDNDRTLNNKTEKSEEEVYFLRNQNKIIVEESEDKREAEMQNDEQSSDILMRHIHMNKPLIAYPLKLINNDNSCYSNVMLQVLIHLGISFENLVYQSDNEFKAIFQLYHVALYSQPKNYTSIALREFVGNYRPNNFYLDGSQQDTFLFYLDWLHRVPISIQQAFSFKHTILRKCQCGMETERVNENERCFNMTLNTELNITLFSDCFSRYVQEFCFSCKKEQPHRFVDTFEFNETSKYMALSVQLFQQAHGSKKIASKLHSYDYNRILIPTDRGFQQFKVSSIIIRNGETHTDGHYKIWVRSLKKPKWLYICDIDGVKEYLKPLNNLNNIQMIFLEKI